MRARAVPVLPGVSGPEAVAGLIAAILMLGAPLLGLGLGFLQLGRRGVCSAQRAGRMFGGACQVLGPIVMAQHFVLSSGAGLVEAFARQPALSLGLSAAWVAMLTWAVPKRGEVSHWSSQWASHRAWHWVWAGLQVSLAGYLGLSVLLMPVTPLTAGVGLVVALLAWDAVRAAPGPAWLWPGASAALLGTALLSPPLFNAEFCHYLGWVRALVEPAACPSSAN